MQSYAVYYLNAFLLSLVLTSTFLKLAPRIGLVDKPGGRKDHEGRVPLSGGMAMFLAFIAAAMLLNGVPASCIGLFSALPVLVLIGTVDDLIDLKAGIKLAAQSTAVIVMVMASGLLTDGLTDLFDGNLSDPSWLIAVLSIVFIIGLTNALNMMDGLDGLAGGIALIALLWLAVAAGQLGMIDYVVLLLSLAFVVLGFLVFNMRHPWQSRAAVFMGDTGSTMLGFSIAFFGVDLSFSGHPAFSPIAVLWICAVPVIDTLSLIVRRALAGCNPLSGDKRHLHHLLRQAGFSVSETVLTLLAVSVILGGLGVGGWYLGIPDPLMLLGLALPAALHGYFVHSGWQRVRPPRYWRIVARHPRRPRAAIGPHLP